MNISFLDAIKKRRSIYALGKQPILGKDRIRELVEFSILHTPSSFNSQSARVVILFDKESSKFWDRTLECLKKLVSPQDLPKTEEKIKSFDSGYGTLLFFEDQKIVEDLMKNFPLYKDNFPVWSLQSNGMLQFAIWTALESEGLGASLQHYNPLVDAFVQKEWTISPSWKLLAQMPFGAPVRQAGEKEFAPLASRIKVLG